MAFERYGPGEDGITSGLRRGADSAWRGLLAWLLAWLLALGALACGDHAGAPSIVLVSIDTLRADHLGIYGYARDTSPHIDRFFEGGTVFEAATSSAPCTIPAVRQFLEGAFVRDPERPNLAEILRAHGYATAAIVSQHQFHRRTDDYARGFDHFDVQPREAVDLHGFTARTAQEVADRALEWLDANADDAPFLLWLHFFDPHDPYDPPAEHRAFGNAKDIERSGDPRAEIGRGGIDVASFATLVDMPLDRFDADAWAHYSARYDAEIHFVDAEFGRVLERLRERGLVDDTVVALLSDHGEWLGEDRHWTHCLTLREPEVHVPFLLRVARGPLGEDARVSEPVSTLDLLPTLVGLAGAPLPAGEYHGVDLHAAPSGRVVASTWSGQVAVRDREWKLILENGAPIRLYHTARDPVERWNRLFDRGDTAARLEARAMPFVALRESIDAENIERALRKIGYIR